MGHLHMNEFSVKRVSIDSMKTPIDQPQKRVVATNETFCATNRRAHSFVFGCYSPLRICASSSYVISVCPCICLWTKKLNSTIAFDLRFQTLAIDSSLSL